MLSVKNRAESTLSADITAADTSLTVPTGGGTIFPTTNFYITIEDEILLCTLRTTDTLTVVRAQEGTTAAAHIAGKTVELRITAGVIQDIYFPTAETYTPAAAGTATLDLDKSTTHRITMPAGNITIALSGGTNAQKFIVEIIQDSVGSRTVTWFTTIKWADGTAPTLTTTANKKDTFGFERTGADTYDGFIIGQNI